MDQERVINNVLVMLFNEILDMEEKALIKDKRKDISINDVHIIDAIGLDGSLNMSRVAQAMSVTVGTLTTAINGLVKKGYVARVRSEKDRRVVLLALTDKGTRVYEDHAAFHQKMVDTVMEGFEGEELDILIRALEKLRRYFKEL